MVMTTGFCPWLLIQDVDGKGVETIVVIVIRIMINISNTWIYVVMHVHPSVHPSIV